MKMSESRRKRIFEIIQIGNREDFPSRAFDIGIVIAIVANITVLLLDTFDELSAYDGLFRVIEIVTVLIFCVMFAYLIPSVITVEYIKSHEINGIKPFMVDEAAFFCPAAFLACIIAELVFSALSASQSETDFSGMGTLIFCLSGVILTAAFWLVYFVVDKAYKKTE